MRPDNQDTPYSTAQDWSESRWQSLRNWWRGLNKVARWAMIGLFILGIPLLVAGLIGVIVLLAFPLSVPAAWLFSWSVSMGVLAGVAVSGFVSVAISMAMGFYGATCTSQHLTNSNAGYGVQSTDREARDENTLPESVCALNNRDPFLTQDINEDEIDNNSTEREIRQTSSTVAVEVVNENNNTDAASDSLETHSYKSN